jgi:hypothetical protein
MKKLSPLTQSMANTLPEWSRIRTDEQSLGQRFLDSIALPMERADKELIRSTRNFHLVTANLDEIDWIYRINLGHSYIFENDLTDPFNITPIPPMLSGILDSVAYPISLASNNDLETFWYRHLPDRLSIEDVIPGTHILLDDVDANTSPFSGIDSWHPNHLQVELHGAEEGQQYITVTENNTLERAKVVIHGTTRKGTAEDEVMVFPWDQKQTSMKEWQSVDHVDCYGVPSGVTLSIQTFDFNNGPYIDFWNLAESVGRNKIDQFWNIGETVYGSTLDLIQYTSDDIRQLLNSLFQLYVERSFELFDIEGNNIEAIDMKQQPFTDWIWVTTANQLLCYSSDLTMAESTEYLKQRTPDAKISIDLSSLHVVRGESVDVEFANLDTFSSAVKSRLSLVKPDGTTSGILAGELTSDSESWQSITDYRPAADRPLTLVPDQLGEYIFTAELLMNDGTAQKDVRILCVDSKEPLAQFDLPVSGVLGIDFDSDQKMWLYTASGYHQVNFHHDVMMIDYDNKVIFTREPYDEVLIY